MTTVQHLIDQQLGVAAWRSFDHALWRLRCPEQEEYKQICFKDDAAPVDSPIFACKFAQKQGYEHVLALANEDGKLAVHDTTNKEDRFGKQVHHNAIFDLAWMFKQMKLVTVSGDHTARLVDISNADVRVEHMFCGHTRSVKTIAIKQNDSSVFATGSRDGSILLWDVRSSLSYNFVSKPDRVICNAHFAKTSATPTSKRRPPTPFNPYVSGANSVTGLVFQDENTLVSCSAGDGAIKVWDLRKSYKNKKKEPCPKNTIPYCGNTTRCGFSNLIFDRDCVKLYANCLDHVIYCYNMAACNPDPIMKYVGHQNNTFYVKSCLSGDDLYLLSGSSDQNAYIWNTHSPEPVIKLRGHNAEVTCVAWCQKRDPAIVTCSDDMRHKIWRVGPEILPDNWQVIGRGVAESASIKRPCDTADLSAVKKLKRCPSCDHLDLNLCERCSRKRPTACDFESETKRRRTGKGARKLFKAITVNSDGGLLVGAADDVVDDGVSLKTLKIDVGSREHNALKSSESPTSANENEFAQHNVKSHGDRRLSETLSDLSNRSGFINSGEGVVKTNASLGTQPSLVDDRSSSSSDGHPAVTTPKSSRGVERGSPDADSPTVNLPNFVVDGSAPHLHYSPQKRFDRDWLTKLRVERSLIREMRELAGSGEPSPPKVPKLGNSPRSRSAKKRRDEPRCRSPQSPLLKFFRVTNSSIMKDSQCASKASLNRQN